MRLASEKFKYLSPAKEYLPPGTIPEYEILCELKPRDIHGTYILRSALKNESTKVQLLSGKSVSISGIDSWQKLTAAWEKVSAQAELEEVILQTEIPWQTHITLIYEKDFFFAELKEQGKPHQFIYWTPLAASMHEQILKLHALLAPLKPLLKKESLWLMEAGMSEGKIYLFQLHPIESEVLTQIFSSEMVAQIVSSRMRFSQSQGLLSLLKTEAKARQFRKTLHTEFRPSLVFLNWEYLFHYFKLYCMMKRLVPDAQSFASFLTSTYQHSWLSTLVKRHLELAQFFRTQEVFDPMKVGFQTNDPIFVGKGFFEGVVGREVMVCEEISLDIIYGKSKPQVILTNEVGLLGHPVLASVENGVRLVLGVKTLPQAGARIYLDFDRKSLKVE